MSRIATALEKERAKEMVRGYIIDLIINLALAIGVAYYWLDAPGWGAWLIFMVLQHSDTTRRRWRYLAGKK